MSISLLTLIMIGIIVLLMSIGPICKSNKKDAGKEKQSYISWTISGLLVLNWLLFLTNSYSFIPDVIFTPVWFILSVAGIGTVVYEWRRNKRFVVFLAGLSTISLLFTVLSYGIGEM